MLEGGGGVSAFMAVRDYITACVPFLQLWERFKPGQKPPAGLGASRDYNVDLVPKFIMANGNLVKVFTSPVYLDALTGHFLCTSSTTCGSRRIGCRSSFVCNISRCNTPNLPSP